jgi:hypothetical protein
MTNGEIILCNGPSIIDHGRCIFSLQDGCPRHEGEKSPFLFESLLSGSTRRANLKLGTTPTSGNGTCCEGFAGREVAS